jgi:protein SCO1/2
MIITTANLAYAQLIRDEVPELQKIDVAEHYGEYIPLDLPFVDETGKQVYIKDYFNNKKPVLLILAYYECPMLCTFVLNGVTEAVYHTGLDLGKDYQIVTISIDPQENAELAMNKKIAHMNQLQRKSGDNGWVFLTGKQENIEQLAKAVGFEYYYVEDNDEYAHPAVIMLLTEEGRISRYLYGIEYNPRDLKLGLLEASMGNIGSTIDRLLLYCFHYDPDSKGYVLFATNVMKLGGAATLGLLGLFLSTFWIKEARMKKR